MSDHGSAMDGSVEDGIRAIEAIEELIGQPVTAWQARIIDLMFRGERLEPRRGRSWL